MNDLNPKSLEIFDIVFSNLPLDPKLVERNVKTIKDLLDFMCESIVQDISDDKKRFICHLKMGLQIYRFAVNADTFQINADSIKIMN